MNGGPQPQEYLARIVAVRIDGVVVADPPASTPPSVTYDIETYRRAGIGYFAKQGMAPSNRRAIVDTFRLIPAAVGDECWLRIVDGQAKLIVIEGVYAESC